LKWYDKVIKTVAESRGFLNTSYSGNLTGMDIFKLMTNITNSGEEISERNALEIGAVNTAVRIISESIASLPLHTYKRDSQDNSVKALKHPVYKLLHSKPNKYMSSFIFWDTIIQHAVYWGNGYAQIDWGKDGQVKSLFPLRPDQTQVVVDVNGKIYYETIIRGKTFRLIPEQVLHIKGMGFDGITGYSPIYLHREMLGLAKATEKYGAKFFSNGGVLSGVLETPNVLSDGASTNLRNSWNSIHSGVDNAHKVAILEEGLTYKTIGLPPEDSQFLETRKFTVSEIARMFRVPPHKLADLERSTNNNIEHQSLEFVTDTLRPWIVRIEQEINMKLFTESEQEIFYVEHNLDGLLRGDIKTRYESYQIARQNGWMSANDIRRKENMNSIDDSEGGNAYLVNTAMQPIKILLNPPQPAEPVDPKGKGGGKGDGKNAQGKTE
jgi:HK97 family phage portal protein